MFVNGSGRNEHSLQKIFHRCFLPSFGSFDQVVSEEKIKKNRAIRNKNCLWRPCLLMDRDKMSKVYRGPSIDASYQVSVHLAKGFQRRRLKCEKLTDDRRQVMAKAHIALARWGENKWANIIFKNYHIFYLKTKYFNNIPSSIFSLSSPSSGGRCPYSSYSTGTPNSL